jgi:ribosomal protein L37AE/L43A
MTYPRSRNGWLDDGSLIKASNRRDNCPKCGSANYRETISMEKCNSCGLQFDYWGGGGNEVYREWEAAEALAERRREWEEEYEQERRWRETGDYD